MLRGSSKGLSLEMIGIYFLIIISLSIGIAVAFSIFSNPPSSQDVDRQLSKNIDPYGKDICGSYDPGQTVSELDFKRLLLSHYNHNCNLSSNYVKVDFTISLVRFEEILTELGVVAEGLPFYLERDGCEDISSFTGVIVESSVIDGIVFQKYDSISIGKRDNGAEICYYNLECGDGICDPIEEKTCSADC